MTRPLTAPGRLVAGRYRLQSQIGGGGMGTVWLAVDELLGRQVAIKQVLSPLGAAPEEADQQRQRALREGRIAARLSHPHAISVYDVATEGAQPWLVMEYLPSRSLATVLAEDGVLRIDQAAQIGAQVADALAATHAAGIVHRDVKPANVLIGEGGRVDGLVKITDFGISHASGDITLTQTGQITGTPAFLAPEVAQGREMTEASDVFSLGATLYTCIEGTPPFGMEENALAMLHKVAGGQIEPPRRAGSLTGPLQKMLAAEPADRPTMPEVRDELARLAAGRDGDTTTVLLARTDLRRPSGRTETFPSEGTSNGAAAAPSPGNAPPAGPTPGTPGAPVERAAAAPARTAAPPAPAPPRERGRRRGRAIWVAAGLVALVLAGLIAFWAAALDPDDPTNDASSTPTAASEPAPTPTESDAAPSTEPTTEEQPGGGPDAAGSVSAEDVDDAAQEFFSHLPDDPEDAYALTSPSFQSRFPYDGFANFWRQYEDVNVEAVEAQDGSTTAAVEIEYVWADGSPPQTELHQVSFVIGDDGQLLLESDEYQRQVG
jgi:serine/threonine protein kinase